MLDRMAFYTVSRPQVMVAKARNICRVCRRSIQKGEKYLFAYFLDRSEHLVTRGNFRNKYPFNEKMKYCKECAIEHLRINKPNVKLSANHKKNVLEALEELLSQGGTRFDLLKGDAPLKEYLKEHGINE